MIVHVHVPQWESVFFCFIRFNLIIIKLTFSRKDEPTSEFIKFNTKIIIQQHIHYNTCTTYFFFTSYFFKKLYKTQCFQ